MIELPEALTLSKELNAEVTGKTVKIVNPPTKPHKFCWFNGAPEDYDKTIKGKTVSGVKAFGLFVEIDFSDNSHLCINDGVNVRLISEKDIPKDYQLLILFNDGTALLFTVSMYGGIVLHGGEYDNEYYIKSQNSLSPFSAEFSDYYFSLLKGSKPGLSAKAFLATEQRFPGIGNGVLQDILFEAKIHPKRKIGTFSKEDAERLLNVTVSVLSEMTGKNGRDTEKDIFGNAGGYKTKMSKNTYKNGCPLCGGEITKEAYLGGSVYYCQNCQKL